MLEPPGRFQKKITLYNSPIIFNLLFFFFLALRQKIYNGTDHPEVLLTLHQLACQKGKLGQAQIALEELQIILGQFIYLYL